MKRILERISNWLKFKRACYKSEQLAKQKRRIALESERALQIREFAGELYISLNGAPIVNCENVIGDMVEALHEARAAYRQWREMEVEHDVRR